MSKKVLITGGAGFIGSHLADELLSHGYDVRVLDSLAPRVHEGAGRPAYLSPSVELMVGDVRDGRAVERALDRVHFIVHLAGAVGAGESVFEIDRCMSANNVGTAVLLDRAVRSHTLEKFVLGSSMCVYGEGLYRSPLGARVEAVRRSQDQLRQGKWELFDREGEMTPLPTPETKRPSVDGSVYAASKLDQERTCLRIGSAFGLPMVALRFFNVFGPRQSRKNPYGAELTQAVRRVLGGGRPRVSEDGMQLRDFVPVKQAVMACRLAMEGRAQEDVINVGTGQPSTMASMVSRLACVAKRPGWTPEISLEHRFGDVRHLFADVGKMQRTLGLDAAPPTDDDVAEFVAWVASTTKREPSLVQARDERPSQKSFPVYVQLELGLAS